MNVAIYLRKSRAEEHADTVETLKRHRAILTEYVHTHKLVLLHTYEEVVSGESLYARPQMLEMLENVEHGEYDAILCMDIDRLGRGGMQDQGVILDTFKYSDTKIITPEKTYDLGDDLDEELTEFKTFISRREYKLINKRLRRGLRQTIEEGCYVANAPYGYRKIYKNKKPTLEIYEDEARFVHMIFDMYCEGIGCATIANTINALGAKPHRADYFGRTSVMHILRNPTFAGKVVWDRKKHIRKGAKGNAKHITVYQPKDQWTVAQGIHPPIISVEQFEEAQTIARNRYIPPSNDGTIKSPLAGLVKCRRCGKNMQRMTMGKGIPYLLCNTTGCCAGAKLSYVEDAILSTLGKKMEELTSEIQYAPKNDTGTQEHILAIITKERQKTNLQKGKLHDLLEQGVYDVATYRERMQAISDKLTALEEQEQTAKEIILKSQNEDKKQLVAKIKSVLSVYDTADAKERNKLLKSVVEYIKYDKPKKTKPQDFSIDIKLKTFLYRA